jgi:Meiotically Up-regulated Gene 113 (MUG113) protein
MTERTYRNLKIQELEALVAESWDNEDLLREVEAELSFRHTRRAGRLQSSLETRMRSFDDLPRASGVGSTEAELSLTQENSVLIGKHAGRGYPWHGGCIYFFQAIGEDLFKIGRTSKSPLDRRKGLTGCPYELELVGVLESVDTYAAERSIHRYLTPYRVSTRKEWFRAPKEVITEAMKKFQAVYDVAFVKRNYRVIEGKYLVLDCKIGRDQVQVKTEKCPFCGRRHFHGAGRDYRGHVTTVEGISVLGHRVAHCVEQPVELILPNGLKVNNDDGYYLGIR